MNVILSFADKRTEAIWLREPVKRISPELHALAYRRMLFLDAANYLHDLRIPPGNRLDPSRRRRCRTRGLSLGVKMAKVLAPIHPGVILLEEFLLPFGISQYEVAKVIGVSPRRINEIVHGKRAITADTALRLARAFDLSDTFWLNMQTRYDIETERDRLAESLSTINTLPAVAARLDGEKRAS